MAKTRGNAKKQEAEGSTTSAVQKRKAANKPVVAPTEDLEDGEPVPKRRGQRKVKKTENEDVKSTNSTQKRGRKKAPKKEPATSKNQTEDVDADADKSASTSRGKGKENEGKKANSKISTSNAVARSVVKKGRAVVDTPCPIAGTAHVYCDEEEDVIWDCMLNQTNIQFNNNKYYLIQLLEDDSSKTYNVWMRWGRVGQNGQNSLQPCGSDLAKAMKIFEKKFQDKTKNEWCERDFFEKVQGKYDLVKIDYSPGEDTPDVAKLIEKEKPKQVDSTLHIAVQNLIKLICNVRIMEEAVVEMKYDAKKAPLGKLTEAQIKAGYLALKRIDEILSEAKVNRQDLLQACNDFYTRIPHYFGMKVPPLLSTKADVKEKLGLLEALGDIQAALSVLGAPADLDLHPVDHHYMSLKCNIICLDATSPQYKIIQKYLQSSKGKTHNYYKLSIEEVYQCEKENEGERFKKLDNRMLLWHGSRLSNWAGILSQGLRIAPPEAPATGYMFDKGIYFADCSTKSANYCMATGRNNVGLLVLCEVALGKTNDLLQADYTASKLPAGCSSVKGLGTLVPQDKNLVTMDDGVVVPMGPLAEIKGNKFNYNLQYNEYIVYSVAQVRIRYLVKVNFKF
ncbi:poly [ADP-ribose] polymerase 2-like [Oratosquilla oratoria]|uniref:poly [ADP-ribose] polymerase 2-like n=1 Tax=Oratosquilla oratoria TaxID=337810 RepID=UPI003F759496